VSTRRGCRSPEELAGHGPSPDVRGHWPSPWGTRMSCTACRSDCSPSRICSTCSDSSITFRGEKWQDQWVSQLRPQQCLPFSSLFPPCPSLTACLSLSSVSVLLASLGPSGTVSRPLSVERMGLSAGPGKRQGSVGSGLQPHWNRPN
jgi:hypothetical protein